MPVNVERIVEDCGNTMGWVARGTYTEEEMIEGIKYYEGDDYPMPEKYRLEHSIIRCVPVSPNSDLPYAYQFVYSKPGRGAFKATTIYFDE